MCKSFEEQLIAGDDSLLNSKKRKSPDNKFKPLSKKPKICPKLSLKPEKVEKRIAAPLWTPKTVVLGSGNNSKVFEIINGKPKLLEPERPRILLRVPWEVVLLDFKVPPPVLSPIKTPVKKEIKFKRKPFGNVENLDEMKPRIKWEMEKYKVATKFSARMISPLPLKRTNMRRKLI